MVMFHSHVSLPECNDLWIYQWIFYMDFLNAFLNGFSLKWRHLTSSKNRVFILHNVTTSQGPKPCLPRNHHASPRPNWHHPTFLPGSNQRTPGELPKNQPLSLLMNTNSHSFFLLNLYKYISIFTFFLLGLCLLHTKMWLCSCVDSIHTAWTVSKTLCLSTSNLLLDFWVSHIRPNNPQETSFYQYTYTPSTNILVHLYPISTLIPPYGQQKTQGLPIQLVYWCVLISMTNYQFPVIHKSIDWFKGKITGTSHISWENLWFPVDFPFNWSIE